MTDTERDPAHVCTAGPLCSFYDWDRDPVPGEPAWCGHDSCVRMMCEGCDACLSETLAAIAEQITADAAARS